MSPGYGFAAETHNVKILQFFQSKSIFLITNAPWNVSDHTLHHHIQIQTPSVPASHMYKRFHNHTNPLISILSSITLPDNPTRRLSVNGQ